METMWVDLRDFPQNSLINMTTQQKILLCQYYLVLIILSIEMGIPSKYFITSCLFFSLFCVLTTFLVIRQIYMTKDIYNQIQNLTLLKDNSLPEWGSQPGVVKADYTQSITLYEVSMNDSKITSKKSKYSTNFDYNFKYENLSFAQGNSGLLNFINRWQINPKNDFSQFADQTLSTVNLGADKVYNYDFYAPPSRQLPILYNTLIESLSTNFLLKFYSTYLHKFFFSNKDLVLNTVFLPIGFSSDQGLKIYEDTQYGWNSIDKFSKWVQLALHDQETVSFTQEYEEIAQKMKLSSSEMKGLIADNSALQNIIYALNGTIKTKLMSTRYYGYECEDDFCSNSQLLAAQLGFSFLTSDELFEGLSLEKSTKEFNGTLLNNIQYQGFCDDNPDLQCLDSSYIVPFFSQNRFGDFEDVDLIWSNQQKFQYIEDYFILPEGTGQSVIKYALWLYSSLSDNNSNNLPWSLTNYNNFQPIIDSYYSFLITQLYSRAFTQKNACKDYFDGQFNKYSSICDDDQWNLQSLQSMRNYVQAYFYFSDLRDQLIKITGMEASDISKFFYDSDSSLIAKQIKQIEDAFKTSFSCAEEKCLPNEIFCLQWGSGFVMNNLPQQIFGKTSISILEWDENGFLNNFVPDYEKVIGDKVQVKECMILMNSQANGLFNLFNLISFQKSQTEENKKHLKYVAQVVLNIRFKGILTSQKVVDLFRGSNSTLIDVKKSMNVSTGGAPWLNNYVSLYKLNNNDQIQSNRAEEVPQYSTMNTGIYDRKKLREIKSIWGERSSNSKYLCFKETKKKDDKQISVQIVKKYLTSKIINGTNMLGFQSQLNGKEKLKIYFPWSYQSIDLIRINETTTKVNDVKLSYLYYSLDVQDEEFVGIEELNQYSIQIDPTSTITVQKRTGITVEFNINFVCKNSPTFFKYISEDEKIPIYESTISYKRQDLSEILEVQNHYNEKNKIFTLLIIFSSIALFLSALVIIVGCVRTKLKQKRMKGSLLTSTKSDTLLT